MLEELRPSMLGNKMNWRSQGLERWLIGASLSEPHIDEVVEKKVLYVSNSVTENSQLSGRLLIHLPNIL